jgi:hypothetical protein
MRKFLLFILFTSTTFLLNAQCSVQVVPVMVTCNGACDGSASAYPIGSGPFSFYWIPGGQTTQYVSALCAGSYTLYVTDNTGCNSAETFSISEPQQLYVNTNPQAASCQSCCDGFIISTVVGGTPPYTYQWSTSPPQMSSTAQGVCPGTYTLCVTDAAGCSNCDASTVSFTTGFENEIVSGNLSVFPNPVYESITLDEIFRNETSAVISICDVLGKKVFEKQISSADHLHETISTTDFPDGIYFIVVKSAEGNSVRRFVKN